MSFSTSKMTRRLPRRSSARSTVWRKEVEHMIRALKAEGKKFDYKIFDRAPGAHSFDRTDTKQASEIRLGIYQFLAKHLKPNKPFKSVKDVRKAAYKFN